MKKKYLFFIFLIFAYKGFACSCIGKATVKEEIQKSDLVIVGKIISANTITIKDPNLPESFFLKKHKYKVEVKETFKGHTHKRCIYLITGVGNGDCGFQFQNSKEYIIYITKKNKYFERGNKVKRFYYTDICTRTQELNDKELSSISDVVNKQ